jgi:hypothetical protein
MSRTTEELAAIQRPARHDTARKTFHCAGAVKPEVHYVIDRTEWHRALVAKLAAGSFLLLHAPRQSGKSSAARAVATLLEARTSERFCAIPCTLQSSNTVTVESMWRSIEIELRTSVQSLPIDAPIVARALQNTPLFTDADSFKAFFGSTQWNGFRAILILDEFDKLLHAPADIKAELLNVLRDIKNSSDMLPHARPTAAYALHAVLGMGVHRLLKLAAEQHPDAARRVSPFNVTDAVTVPTTTLAAVEELMSSVQSDYTLTIPLTVVQDILWRSGGHVGLLSSLGQQLLNLCTGKASVTEGELLNLCTGKASVTEGEWFVHMSGTSLYGALTLRNVTVMNMLQSVRHRSSWQDPVVADTRNLLRYILCVPEDANLILPACVARDTMDYMLSEGILVELDPTSANHTPYRILAPLLVSLLRNEVGFNTHKVGMPRLPFSRLPGAEDIDLKRTILELLPYVDIEALHHPLLLKVDGTPFDRAYQFALLDLLLHRVGDGGWHVLPQTTNSAIGSRKRLDILISATGTRCGIVLLADGDDMDQAVVYAREESLRQVLVLYFAARHSAIVPALQRSAPDNVDVMQVYVNRIGRSFTTWNLDVDRTSFKQVDQVKEVTPAHIQAAMAAMHMHMEPRYSGAPSPQKAYPPLSSGREAIMEVWVSWHRTAAGVGADAARAVTVAKGARLHALLGAAVEQLLPDGYAVQPRPANFELLSGGEPVDYRNSVDAAASEAHPYVLRQRTPVNTPV